MSKLRPEFFRREDESPDGQFYRQPRLVNHIDDDALKRVEALYEELLPAGGHILDLMASYESHLSNKVGRVTGLGLNEAELEHNRRLSDYLVFDLNRSESLPFETATFDGAVCTVSVQYMTRPSETFAEVARTLREGAPFVVTFSNRMFPTKAVLVWRSSDDEAHIRLVGQYFGETAAFGKVHVRRSVPRRGDPIYALWAFKEREPQLGFN